MPGLADLAGQYLLGNFEGKDEHPVRVAGVAEGRLKDVVEVAFLLRPPVGASQRDGYVLVDVRLAGGVHVLQGIPHGVARQLGQRVEQRQAAQGPAGKKLLENGIEQAE